jgi:HPt (histidine-containing phosphotransfer) domain-containing protein
VLGVEVPPREARGHGEPASKAEPTSEPIDRTALERLRQTLGEGATRELISTFLSEAPKLLGSIRSAVEAGDLDSLRLAAHTLKSNAATFGAMSLSETARALERVADEPSTGGADDLAARAEHEYQQVRPLMEAERAGPPS